MDQRHAMPCRPFRDRLGTLGVDEEGKLALVLGAIHRSVGRRVDDEIGLEAIERFIKRLQASTDRTRCVTER